MPFPSLKNISGQLMSVIYRFPYTLFMAVVGTITAIFLVEQSYEIGEPSPILFNILVTTILGFFVSVAVEFYTERHNRYGVYVRLFFFILLAVYFFFLPGDYSVSDFDFVFSHYLFRTLLYGFAFLMAITFAPFVWKKEINGFWQHNKTLFLRLFFTGIFTGALYLGLILAIYSADTLLGIQFDEVLYLQLWIFVVGFIATTFFLAGIPKDFSVLEKEKHYPAGLKIFAQFILVPLLILYAFILYTYTAKILFTGEWPESMVSSLVLFFSAAGLLTYFLLSPLQEEKKNVWVAIISKIILILLIPMSGMLFWSLSFRLADYGLTINRYFVFLAGLWFLGITLYFLLSRKKNLKLIPISLFIITILSSFGPWGAVGMAQINQTGRIEEILIKNKVLIEGKIVPLENIKITSEEEQRQLIGAFEYLGRYHLLDHILPWFDGRKDLDPVCLEDYACLLQDGLGINYGYYPEEDAQVTYHYFYVNPIVSTLDISGYDYLLNGVHYFEYTGDDYIEDQGYAKVKLEGKMMTIQTPQPEGFIAKFDISRLLDTLLKQPNQDLRTQEEMTLELPNAKLIIQSINIVNLENEDREIESFDGTLLIKK